MRRSRTIAPTIDRAGSASTGFTLVELITVITLVGILSMVAVPRMVGHDSFGSEEVARSFIGSARLAQQHALAHTDEAVQLAVARTTDGYDFEITRTAGGTPTVLYSLLSEFPEVDLQVAAGALSSSIVVGQTLTLAFTSRSDLHSVSLAGPPLSSVVSGSVDGGVAVTINGNTSSLVCVATSGYAHRGTCL